MEWKHWCRLCASSDGNGSSVFNCEDLLLPEKIFKYLSITIQNQDELPQTVCKTCSQRVCAFDSFADKCLKVQSMYHAMIQEGYHSESKANLFREEYLKDDDDRREDDCGEAQTAPATARNPRKARKPRGKRRTRAPTGRFQKNCTSGKAPGAEEGDRSAVAVGSNPSPRKRRGGSKTLVGAAKRKALLPRVLKPSEDGGEGVAVAGSEEAGSTATADPAAETTEQADSAPEPEDLLSEAPSDPLADPADPLADDPSDTPSDAQSDSDAMEISPADPLATDPAGDSLNVEISQSDGGGKAHELSAEERESITQAAVFRWECHVCKQVFANWNSLSAHCQQMHSVPAQVVCLCTKVLASRASIIKHRLKHTNSYKYKCDKCDKSFHRKSLYDLHVLSHVPKEQQPFVCCKCARRFHCEALLRHHERVHLPREERLVYPCSVCAKKFSSRSNVSAHLRAVHFGERPFVCEQCGNSFTSKGILQEHLTIHSDETPFKCTQCKKSFKTKYRLKIHMDTHRETPYQCPVCPHQLSTRRTLRMHLLVHRDIKAYQCATCGKAFKRSKDLKNHHNLHTGRRPYTCTFCPRTFANGSNCRAHKRKMHPEELRVYEAQLAAAKEAGEEPPAHSPTAQPAPLAPAAAPIVLTALPVPAPTPSPTHAHHEQSPVDTGLILPDNPTPTPVDLKPPIPHTSVASAIVCSDYERHSMFEAGGLKVLSHGGRPVVPQQQPQPQAEFSHGSPQPPGQMVRGSLPHLSPAELSGAGLTGMRLGDNGLCRNPHADLEAGARAVTAVNLNVRRGDSMLNSHLSTLTPLNLNVSEMHASRQQQPHSQHLHQPHQQQHQHQHHMADGGVLSDLEDGYLAGPRRTVDGYLGGRAHLTGLAPALPLHRQQPQPQPPAPPPPHQQQTLSLNHRMHPAQAADPQGYHLYQHHSDSMPSAVAAAIAHSATGMTVPAFPGNPYIHHNMGYSRGGSAM